MMGTSSAFIASVGRLPRMTTADCSIEISSNEACCLSIGVACSKVRMFSTMRRSRESHSWVVMMSLRIAYSNLGGRLRLNTGRMNSQVHAMVSEAMVSEATLTGQRGILHLIKCRWHTLLEPGSKKAAGRRKTEEKLLRFSAFNEWTCWSIGHHRGSCHLGGSANIASVLVHHGCKMSFSRALFYSVFPKRSLCVVTCGHSRCSILA